MLPMMAIALSALVQSGKGPSEDSSSSQNSAFPQSTISRPLPLDREASWIHLRFDEKRGLESKDGFVALADLKPDGKARLLDQLKRGEIRAGQGGYERIKATSRLPEEAELMPVVIETRADAGLRPLLELMQFLSSEGKPHCINLFLKVTSSGREGCVGVPVLFRYKRDRNQVDDGRPYQWYFFAENQIISYDCEPDSNAPWAPHSVTKVRIAPFAGDEILVRSSPKGTFDLIPFVGNVHSPSRFEVDGPVVRLNAKSLGKAWVAQLHAEVEQLVKQSPEATELRRKRTVGEVTQLRNPDLFEVDWRIVRGFSNLEEAMSGLTGPNQASKNLNRILIYTLFSEDSKPTVQDFVKTLDLTKKYGFKGLISEVLK